MIEGALDTKNTSIDEMFKQFLQIYNQVFANDIEEASLKKTEKNQEVAQILAEKFTRKDKLDKILSLYPGEKTTGVFAQFVNIIVGSTGKFKKHFNLHEKKILIVRRILMIQI